MTKEWATQKNGFTIVELLIVIVVIGILAAITMVTYAGMQNNTYDSAIKSDLKDFAKKMGIVKAETGRYPAVVTQAMGVSATRPAYGVDFQNYNYRYCYNSATDSYILIANSKSGKYFKTINSDAPEETPAAYGWSVCSQIGLVNTNPSQNGYGSGTWGSWVN
jgi:prepilin-type N-terminal cleavage/methylation domain-containing protein